MIDRHLVANTRPQANKENVIFWKTFRITVLQNRLFRLENSSALKFRDDATQSVWFRDMPKQDFSVVQGGDSLTIKTDACSLILKEKREDCRIEIDGKLLEIGNADNLRGTFRTLDGYDGDVFVGWQNKRAKDMPSEAKIKLENGVCSRGGVAVLDDSASLSLLASGELQPIYADGTDEYIFVYGDNYRDAVRALYTICGPTPLIPRFALGNWWSRYHIYTDKEYLRLLNRFEESDIPLSVATIDMDWHYSTEMEKDLHISELGRDTEFYGGKSGWTGYTWNPRLFPDYKAFLKKVAAKDLKITLNLHPADGIRWWESCYKDMATAVGIDPDSGEHVKFNIADSDFINAYFSKIHKPYEADGVSFWWIDWQQGVNSSMKGLDPLWALNHYHYLDNASNHSTPLILSRYAGVGSHRYPIGFSGDTFITWETLGYLPEFTATASNIGYTWWSHDIGGHMFGEKNDELYLRHLQYGVFSPINRLHCCNAVVCTKEPFAYGNGTGEIAKNWLRLRHKLIPYLYTASYRTHNDGVALVEPLYYNWKSPEAYTYKNEYLFGGNLICAPITTPTEKDGFARVKAWLPEGVWTDIFTGAQYYVGAGGKEFTMLRQLESFPVLIQAGGILPLSANPKNSVDNPSVMDILVWSGDGKYTLYEDGAVMETDGALFTHFESELCGNTQSLSICTSGDASVIPENRVMRIRFKDIADGRVTLYKNGIKVDHDEILTDCAAIDLEVSAENNYRIEVEFAPQTRLQKLQSYARGILLRAEGEIIDKDNLWKLLSRAESIEHYIELVKDCPLVSDTVKACLLETI